MQFIATLTHDVEHCWASSEKEAAADEWIETMEDHAAEHDVDLRGAYVTPNEHTFYFIMEADTFEAVTAFLGPPLLTDHDGRIAPVMALSEAGDVVKDEH